MPSYALLAFDSSLLALCACSAGSPSAPGLAGNDAAVGPIDNRTEAAAPDPDASSSTEASSTEASSTEASSDASSTGAPSIDFSACPSSPALGDFPLDVGAALHAKCQTCHRNPPVGRAPFPLLNYEDVLVAWNGAPRWQDMYKVIQPGSTPHMPPGNATPLTASQLQTLTGWLAACAQPVPEGTGGDADSSRDAATLPNPTDGASD